MNEGEDKKSRQEVQVSAPQLVELFNSTGVMDGVMRRWQARAQTRLAQEGGEYLKAMNLVHSELEKLMDNRAGAEEAILDYEQRVRAVDEIRNNPELADEMHKAQVDVLKEKLLSKARGRAVEATKGLASEMADTERERTTIARELSEQRVFDRVAQDSEGKPEGESVPIVKFEKLNPEAVAAAVEHQVGPALRAHFGGDQTDKVNSLVGDLTEDILAQIEATRKGEFGT